jgi:hypothetical protein
MKLSNPQQTIIDKMQQGPFPFHFIPWGINYCRLLNGNNEYMGRVRYCVFDALIRKDMIVFRELRPTTNQGWYLK